MREVSYPATATHIEQHNELISRLNEVSKDIAQGALNIKDLQVFLSDWLLVLIRVYDTKLANCVARVESAQVA